MQTWRLGAEDDEVEDAGIDPTQDLGGFELCEVEEVLGVGAGSTGANIWDDLSPELVNLDDHGLSISTPFRGANHGRNISEEAPGSPSLGQSLVGPCPRGPTTTPQRKCGGQVPQARQRWTPACAGITG